MSFYVMYDCILSICFIKEMMMMMMTATLRSIGLTHGKKTAESRI